MLALKSRQGRSLFTEKDLDGMIRALEKQSESIESKARKHERFAKTLISELGEIKLRDLK